MDVAEFDKFAEEYLSAHAQNIKISGEQPDYFARYKIEEIRRRWRAAEPANPAAKPVQRTQFIAPGANPADLFGSYQPQQPAFADLVY